MSPTPARPPRRWILALGLAPLPLAALAIDLASGHGVLAAGAPGGALAAVSVVLLGLGLVTGLRRATDRRPADRRDLAFVLAMALGGLGLLGVDLALELLAQPTGRAELILVRLTMFLAQAALAARALVTVAPAPCALRLVARATGSAALLALALVPIEAWQASRPAPDWYSFVALDGSAADLLVEDPDLRWRLRPGFRGRLVHPELEEVVVEVNSNGLRDRELQVDLPGQALVLGDSFAFGVGVPAERTLARQLEDGGAATRVWNAGVSGYSTLDELVTLDRLVALTHPALVILLVYLGNDLEDNLQFLERHRAAGREAWLDELLPRGSSLARLAATTASAARLDLRAIDRRSRLRLIMERRSSTIRRLMDILDRSAARRGLAVRRPPVNDLLVRSCALAPDSEIQLAVDVTVASIRAVVTRAAALGARTVVCLAPARLQVDLELYEQTLARLEMDPSGYSPDRLQTVLVERCREVGIDVTDPTEELRRRLLQGHPVYYEEGHWTVEGNAVAARAILARLEAELAPETSAPSGDQGERR
jgi:hypothetical protein